MIARSPHATPRLGVGEEFATGGSSPIVEVRGVGKRFVGVRALDDINLQIDAGTVHGLVGENGAGKSTLGRIIGGALAPDSGQLLMNGAEVSYHAPRDALALGVAAIQQELALVPGLTVLENVLLGVESRRFGAIDRAVTRRRYERLVDRTGFDLPANVLVGRLSVADQMKVEIMRAIARDAQVIVMDEPTASLTPDEAGRLHDVIRQLRADGIAIVYVSHFLEEVLELADRVTVLRNGRLIETVDIADASMSRLVRGMLGKELEAGYPDKRCAEPSASVALRATALRNSALQDVSLQIRGGEIVGLGGLVGSGRSEVARAIFGLDAVDGGEVEVAGQHLRRRTPAAAIRAGIGFAPEDRKTGGLVMAFSQRANLTLSHLGRVSTRGFVRPNAERRVTKDMLEVLEVTPPDPDRPVVTLSGGNQQKILIGKTMLHDPRVVILDEPTRGVDISAKRAIHDLVADLAAKGVGVLVISSEIDELVGLSHRVLVMRRGAVVAELEGSRLTASNVLHAAFGMDAREEEEHSVV